MTIPTSYTEATLNTYMQAVLGDMHTSLGFVSGDYDEAVNETLLDYGVSLIADATDIRKLRALARIEAWKLALNNAAARYNYSADGGSFSRSQLHDHCLKSLQMAIADGIQYIPDYEVEMDTVEYPDNPYSFHPIGTRIDMRRENDAD